MESFPITEVGVAVTAVGTLYWVVKAFLKHLSKKDEVFTNTINNHLTHSTAAQVSLKEAVDKLHDKL